MGPALARWFAIHEASSGPPGGSWPWLGGVRVLAGGRAAGGELGLQAVEGGLGGEAGAGVRRAGGGVVAGLGCRRGWCGGAVWWLWWGPAAARAGGPTPF